MPLLTIWGVSRSPPGMQIRGPDHWATALRSRPFARKRGGTLDGTPGGTLGGAFWRDPLLTGWQTDLPLPRETVLENGPTLSMETAYGTVFSFFVLRKHLWFARKCKKKRETSLKKDYAQPLPGRPWSILA